MKELKVIVEEEELKKKAATLTVTGRYRESLNIMIYLMDRRNRERSLPLVLPREANGDRKLPKC